MNFKSCIGNKLLFGLFIIILCLPLLTWSQVQKRNYAVIGLKNAEGVTTGEAEIIADRLRIELFNTGAVSMMERDQMQEILSEQGFQQTGACTDEACMVEIGQLLGVERLISGSIGKLGSMFLLNFRTIDVQTAKIITVVSKDISGGIEDVVKLLPSIARELVADAPPEKPAPEDVEPEEKEPEKVEEKPETKEPEESEEKELEPKVIVDESRKEDRNKNRGGIRLSFNVFFGDIFMERYSNSDNEWQDYINKEDIDKLNDNAFYSGLSYNKSHFRFQANFIIKTGPFLTIDIGPGMMSANKKFGFTYEDYDLTLTDYLNVESQWRIIAPNISTGINFIKRFYPIKINAGFLFDINFNVIRFIHYYNEYGYNLNSEYYTFVEDIDDIDFAVNVSFGPRVGVEIMGGGHFGFSVDFLYRYYKLEKEFEFVNKDDDTTFDIQYRFKMPGVGLGAGLNFYF